MFGHMKRMDVNRLPTMQYQREKQYRYATKNMERQCKDICENQNMDIRVAAETGRSGDGSYNLIIQIEEKQEEREEDAVAANINNYRNLTNHKTEH